MRTRWYRRRSLGYISRLLTSCALQALEVNIIGFYQYVSTNKELRDASSEAEKQLNVRPPAIPPPPPP